MNSITGRIINAMIEYYGNDIRRINHFLKVYSFAKTIGELEQLDEKTQTILETAAVTHDIGIKNSEIKYNSSAGNYQQIEGPPEARKLLSAFNTKYDITERVCWLIAHHHTYTGVNEIDHQILLEADFLVNAFEDNLSQNAVRHFKERVFKTKSGIHILNNMYTFK